MIRSGPYAVVRHPIYTGLFVAAAGTALVVGEWRGVLAVALLLAAHSRKALREESLLTGEFGEEYRNSAAPDSSFRVFLPAQEWTLPANALRIEGVCGR